MDEKTEIELSRCRHALMAGGIWVLLFMLWSLLRDVSYYIVESKNLGGIIDPEADVLLNIITLLFLLAVLYIDLSLRIKISRNAFAEARGETFSPYLRKAFFLAICSFFGLFYYLLPDSGVSFELPSFLLELSSFAALCEVIVSSLRIKKLQQEGRGSDAA